MLRDGNVKDKWEIRSLQRLPKEEPQWWKPSQRSVVMEKIRKNNLEKKRVTYAVPVIVTQTIHVLGIWRSW